MTVLDDALPDGVDVVVDAGNTGAAAIHHLPVRRSGRFVVALGMGGMGYSFGAGDRHGFARERRAHRGDRRRRLVLHARHGDSHRDPVPAAGDLVLFNNNAHAMCVTREQLFYDDRYSYNRFAPSRLGAGLAAMFPGLPSVDVDRHRRAARRAARLPWHTTGRRWSASSARPTRSRRSHRFSAMPPQQPFNTKGDDARCRCPRLTT